MRALPALVVLVAIGFLPTTVPAAADVSAVLPVDFEFVRPGHPQEVNGTLLVHLPAGNACTDAVAYGVARGNSTRGAQVELLTGNGSIPRRDFDADGNASRPLRLRIGVAPDAEAFGRIDVRLRLRTEACGDVAAAQRTVQTGARVGFVPDVRLEQVSESNQGWIVRATNHGNAAVRLDWVVREPALGRVLSGSATDVPGPPDANRTAQLSVAKAGADPAAWVLLDARIVYGGNYAYHPSERPPVGNATLTLREPPKAASEGSRIFQYGLAGLGVGLIVVGLVGALVKRRRKGP